MGPQRLQQMLVGSGKIRACLEIEGFNVRQNRDVVHCDHAICRTRLLGFPYGERGVAVSSGYCLYRRISPTLTKFLRPEPKELVEDASLWIP